MNNVRPDSQESQSRLQAYLKQMIKEDVEQAFEQAAPSVEKVAMVAKDTIKKAEIEFEQSAKASADLCPEKYKDKSNRCVDDVTDLSQEIHNDINHECIRDKTNEAKQAVNDCVDFSVDTSFGMFSSSKR